MPYQLGRRGDQHCVIKQDTGEPVPGGCHDTEEQALNHLRALEANVDKALALEAKSMVTAANASGLRHMLIVTSNAYRDREREIVSEKALNDYVDSCWEGEIFKGDNPLLVWHAGDPIGDIVFSDMFGPFLVEVARERPNAPVDLADEGEAPFVVQIKAVWDALERETDSAASHAFFPLASDRKDGTYWRIYKRETSVLPRFAAANLLTDSEVIGAR